jgi:hypothetical protein
MSSANVADFTRALKHAEYKLLQLLDKYLVGGEVGALDDIKVLIDMIRNKYIGVRIFVAIGSINGVCLPERSNGIELVFSTDLLISNDAMVCDVYAMCAGAGFSPRITFSKYMSYIQGMKTIGSMYASPRDMVLKIISESVVSIIPASPQSVIVHNITVGQSVPNITVFIFLPRELLEKVANEGVKRVLVMNGIKVHTDEWIGRGGVILDSIVSVIGEYNFLHSVEGFTLFDIKVLDAIRGGRSPFIVDDEEAGGVGVGVVVPPVENVEAKEHDFVQIVPMGDLWKHFPKLVSCNRCRRMSMHCDLFHCFDDSKWVDGVETMPGQCSRLYCSKLCRIGDAKYRKCKCL